MQGREVIPWCHLDCFGILLMKKPLDSGAKTTLPTLTFVINTKTTSANPMITGETGFPRMQKSSFRKMRRN